MITFLAIGTVLIFASFFAAEAQVKVVLKKINYAITANPVALTFKKLPITYEHKLDNKSSATAGLIYNSKINGYNGFDLALSWRYYMKGRKQPLDGFSFGPSATVGWWSPTEDASKSAESGIAMTIGAEAAYKYRVPGGKGLVVEPHIAYRYMFLTPDDTFFESKHYEGFSIGVGIGYAFNTW